MRFRRFSLSWLPWRLPELLYRHQAGAIGTVDALEWTPAGLRVTCTTDHPAAKLCGAFSVSATIQDYAIIDADDPENFHAEIKSAWLDEVSLTPVPANPAALVLQRQPRPPAVEFYDLMKSRISVLRGMIGVIDMKGAQL